nr:hypothetical protein [Candidatus Woesebacteria bacterium]
LHFEDIDSSLRTHFAYYRLLVTLLVLGATAKVLDCTVRRLQERLKNGDIKHARDSDVEAIGNAHAVICEGFSAIISLLPQYGRSLSSKNHIDVAASLKAHIIHNAYSAIDSLSQMHGAAGFESASVISKTFLDARGFMFADGIHSELLRSVGMSKFDGKE